MSRLLRSYLLTDGTLSSLIDEKAIYQVEKPEKEEKNTFIVFNSKILTGGYVYDNQLEFRIVSKSIEKNQAIEKRLIEMLDDPRGQLKFKNDDCTIHAISLVNGGGTIREPDTGLFYTVLYFLIKTTYKNEGK